MGYPRKVIDGHYHIEQWSRKDGMDFFGSTKEYQQGRGIHAVNLCSIPCFRPNRPSPGAEMNVMAALYKLQNPETYVHGGLAYDQFPLTGVMPEGMDPLSQYRDMMAMGCDGIKILETKPTVIRAMRRTAPILSGMWQIPVLCGNRGKCMTARSFPHLTRYTSMYFRCWSAIPC